MRVETNRPIGPTASRRGGKVDGNGSFAEALAGEPAAAPAGAAPVGGLGALFSLQEVPDATVGRRKAIARGAHILDRLGELQLGLLGGTLDRNSLADLAATVRTARAAADDPRLQAILDEIELRAAVELAKLSNAV
jgi:Class II flagellar assembly regulator